MLVREKWYLLTTYGPEVMFGPISFKIFEKDSNLTKDSFYFKCISKWQFCEMFSIIDLHKGKESQIRVKNV
jgi:hypothetical protein